MVLVVEVEVEEMQCGEAGRGKRWFDTCLSPLLVFAWASVPPLVARCLTSCRFEFKYYKISWLNVF